MSAKYDLRKYAYYTDIQVVNTFNNIDAKPRTYFIIRYNKAKHSLRFLFSVCQLMDTLVYNIIFTPLFPLLQYPLPYEVAIIKIIINVCLIVMVEVLSICLPNQRAFKTIP